MVEVESLKNYSSYFNPVKVVYQSVDFLNNHLEGSSVLIVTTAGFIKRGLINKIKTKLKNKEIIIWSEVKPNPSIIDIENAINELKKNKINVVVGIGGGSAIDTAKIIAVMLDKKPNLSLRKLLLAKKEFNKRTKIQLIAIPTTAGTGSEVTQYATIWDTLQKKKYSFVGIGVYPDISIIDASLLMSLDKNNTLYPALDSISHALESIWNKNTSPISLMFAYSSLEMSIENLPKIILKPKDIEIRKNLMIASTLSGIAISQTKTAIAHAISYPLTLKYNVPHGLASSFTLSCLIDLYLSKRSDLPVKNKRIIIKSKKLLEKLNLQKEIKKFCSESMILKLIDSNSLNERLDNFIYKKNLNIHSIIKKSLEDNKL
jgi:phosphonate metabolism-associated iron-containing alcohol dehydrogenase